MLISISLLKKLNACDEGIKDFQLTYGDEVSIDWTLQAQLDFLKSNLRKYLGWMVKIKLVPLWSLNNSNLSGADLSGANLSGADLSGAGLSGANLSGLTSLGLASKQLNSTARLPSHGPMVHVDFALHSGKKEKVIYV